MKPKSYKLTNGKSFDNGTIIDFDIKSIYQNYNSLTVDDIALMLTGFKTGGGWASINASFNLSYADGIVRLNVSPLLRVRGDCTATLWIFK